MNNPLKHTAPEVVKTPVATNTAPHTETVTSPTLPAEIGGRKDGTDPTRYGDWEKRGKCVDF